MSERIWQCKIGGNAGELPKGSDFPMRVAIGKAFAEITGVEAEFCFSGWAAELDPIERGIIEEQHAKRATPTSGKEEE